MSAFANRREIKTAWLVTETSYGRIWGWRHFLDKAEAEKTAATWRSQNEGIVTVERCEVPA